MQLLICFNKDNTTKLPSANFMKISEIYDYFCKLFVSKQNILAIDTCKKDLITFCWNVAIGICMIPLVGSDGGYC